MALINKLNAIGDAIRAKNGATEKYSLDGMVEAIGAIETGSSDIPEEAFLLTGSCEAKFKSGGWDWFLNTYGNKIKTSNIYKMNEMFRDSKVEHIPFELNLSSTQALVDASYSLYGCSSLRDVPYINGSIGNMYAMFSQCLNIREIPEDWASHIDWTRFHTTTSWSDCRHSNLFSGCYSLRKAPESLLSELWGKTTSSNAAASAMFQSCASLDEVIGFRGLASTMTSNQFASTFSTCCRLKRLVFGIENGQPRVEYWKNQTIDLSSFVGYAANYNKDYITGYNSGITADKEVKDDATYAALKNDADWFTIDMNYSRYNHDSAVETINSLPDTSAYIASSGGTNTIKFKGASGAKTDSGAINTLTAEEIAVATAKGWTVTLS